MHWLDLFRSSYHGRMVQLCSFRNCHRRLTLTFLTIIHGLLFSFICWDLTHSRCFWPVVDFFSWPFNQSIFKDSRMVFLKICFLMRDFISLDQSMLFPYKKVYKGFVTIGIISAILAFFLSFTTNVLGFIHYNAVICLIWFIFTLHLYIILSFAI